VSNEPEPINGTALASDASPALPPTGVVVTGHQVILAEGQSTFSMDVQEPGIVRAAAFWLHEPKVLASAMRGVRQIPMPLLFVESKIDGETKKRTFAFAPTGAVLGVKEGHEARYLATAIMQMQNGMLSAHLFEIVEVPS